MLHAHTTINIDSTSSTTARLLILLLYCTVVLSLFAISNLLVEFLIFVCGGTTHANNMQRRCRAAVCPHRLLKTTLVYPNKSRLAVRRTRSIGAIIVLSIIPAWVLALLRGFVTKTVVICCDDIIGCMLLPGASIFCRARDASYCVASLCSRAHELSDGRRVQHQGRLYSYGKP